MVRAGRAIDVCQIYLYILSILTLPPGPHMHSAGERLIVRLNVRTMILEPTLFDVVEPTLQGANKGDADGRHLPRDALGPLAVSHRETSSILAPPFQFSISPTTAIVLFAMPRAGHSKRATNNKVLGMRNSRSTSSSAALECSKTARAGFASSLVCNSLHYCTPHFLFVLSAAVSYLAVMACILASGCWA